MNTPVFVSTLLGSLIVVSVVYLSVEKQAAPTVLFKEVTIDAQGPVDPWGKALGDINGDAKLDIIVGGRSSQELVWYENPGWVKHIVATGQPFSTDISVVDIDNDGKNDIVAVTKEGLWWYQNPNWHKTLISEKVLHDVETADFDGDGDVDIVARNQSAFGGRGDELVFFMQDAGKWSAIIRDIPNGEGLKAADLNKDQRVDVIVSNVWFAQEKNHSPAQWQAYEYGKTWQWPHVFIDVGDINNDGQVDIVLAPAEPSGEKYRLSWFEFVPSEDSWKEHVVINNLESVNHFVGVADFNNDGAVDIATAEMYQGADPDYVSVYLNRLNAQHWEEVHISTKGSHSARLGDMDNDGDIDIVGANWSGDDQSVKMWLNQTCPAESPWVRHVIDEHKPWRSVFIYAADINNDHYTDIVTGGWWYENPGKLHNAWKRHAVGENANNVAWVWDADNDGDMDMLLSKWQGEAADGGFVFARNSGGGKFIIDQNLPAGKGDFLQGVVKLGQSQSTDSNFILSWHKKDQGLELLSYNAFTNIWTITPLSSFSQDEALDSGDIDRDGDYDISTGTFWLQQTQDGYSPQRISKTSAKPDRHKLVDMNNDGNLDIVVGFEAISTRGQINWYEQPVRLTSDVEWIEHNVANIVGPMSLDVADVDRDGDLDIVAGEHNLTNPGDAQLFWFENKNALGTQWETHLIYKGDEHHDGAQLVDIDNDGDMDVISIGWENPRVILYENKFANCTIQHSLSESKGNQQ